MTVHGTPTADPNKLQPGGPIYRATRRSEFVPFLEFPIELRKIVYTTNAIESLNARFRRAVRYRGHFPNEH